MMANIVAEVFDTRVCWFLDSGASRHVTGFRDKFIEMREAAECNIILYTGAVIQPRGQGVISIPLPEADLTLDNALYYPDLTINVLSIARLTENGLKVTITDRRAYVTTKKGRVLFKADKDRHMFVLEEFQGDRNFLYYGRRRPLVFGNITVALWYRFTRQQLEARNRQEGERRRRRRRNEIENLGVFQDIDLGILREVERINFEEFNLF